nr:phenylalanine--tRNA ligase subunit alpha [Acidobacteriota bacterium]
MNIPELKDFSEASLRVAFLELQHEFDADMSVDNPDDEQLRLKWLGRKGKLKVVSEAWLKSAPVEAKKLLGISFNEFKGRIESQIAGRAAVVEVEQQGGLDVTLPGVGRRLGVEHPLVKTMAEIVGVFQRMGYSVGLGPEVETD